MTRPTNSTLLDPLFQAVDAPTLTEGHLTGLAAGTLAAVRIPGFMPPADCARVVAHLDDIPLDAYDAIRVDPPIRKFGPVLNDHRSADGGVTDNYWAKADEARAAWNRARFRPDPLQHSLTIIGQAWGQAVSTATVGGRLVFTGTLREINAGAHVHYDEVVREFAMGLFDQRVVAQLAFNLFLDVPTSGGETTVWRQTWGPQDEEHKAGYGYRPDVVDGAQRVTLAPAVGDGLIFNPRHYHGVSAGLGGRRIAVAFFLAVTSSGSLIAWS